MDEKDKPQAIPVRAVSKKRYKLPEPIKPLSGTGGWVPPEPKRMRLPSGTDDFPGDLWPRAVVILSKLIQKFPNETHLSELCEHIVTEMTPLYCEAVETGKMKAGAVVTDGRGMEELLRLFLIRNDPSHSVSGLSNQAWEILQKVKTATWGKLAEAIADVQQRTANPTPIDGSPLSITGDNIDRLRKECGWSFNDLANKTGLEKKLIIGHVNKGKGLQPKTLRIYADAFSRQLGRKVSVAELETES